jgi:site-specific DNA-methyltransferase (adenine-specific)
VSVDLRQGHVLDLLRDMPSASVHMVCTSPPYYALRDYGLAS